jgi:hypothetical protein
MPCLLGWFCNGSVLSAAEIVFTRPPSGQSSMLSNFRSRQRQPCVSNCMKKIDNAYLYERARIMCAGNCYTGTLKYGQKGVIVGKF